MIKTLLILIFFYNSSLFAFSIPPSEENIKKALIAYEIKSPLSLTRIYYDKNLSDRAKTYFLEDGHKEVAIGPGAFSSWQLLGSTLAHEIEVHCLEDYRALLYSAHKDLYAIEAEIKAYSYEIKNKARFSLSDKDLEDISYWLKDYQRQKDRADKNLITETNDFFNP